MKQAPYSDSVGNIHRIKVNIHFYNKAKYISHLLLHCRKNFDCGFSISQAFLVIVNKDNNNKTQSRPKQVIFPATLTSVFHMDPLDSKWSVFSPSLKVLFMEVY